MNTLKIALLGSALAVTLGTVVMAQGEGGGQQLSDFQLMNGRVIVVSPSGRVTMRAVDGSSTISEATKDARLISSGSILIMRDNKVYAASDRPMQGGTMLSEMIATR